MRTYDSFSFPTRNNFKISFSHLTSLFLSVDGHFGLPRKDKTDDEDDIALTEGTAFFPKDAPYQEYILKAGESTEVRIFSTHGL